jgi:hypothetical protein
MSCIGISDSGTYYRFHLRISDRGMSHLLLLLVGDAQVRTPGFGGRYRLVSELQVMITETSQELESRIRYRESR